MPNFGTRKRKVYHMCTTKWGEKTSISTHFSRLWYSFGTQIAICGTPFSGCTTSKTIIFYNFNHFYNIYSFSKKDILLYISGFIADILVCQRVNRWLHPNVCTRSATQFFLTARFWGNFGWANVLLRWCENSFRERPRRCRLRRPSSGAYLRFHQRNLRYSRKAKLSEIHLAICVKPHRSKESCQRRIIHRTI